MTLFLLKTSILLSMIAAWHITAGQVQKRAYGDRIDVRSVPEDKNTGAEWKRILDFRNGRSNDSIAILTKHFSVAERDWYALIASREAYWEYMIDSLAVPFDGIMIKKVAILTGLGGVDDKFTFGNETICFDLSVLEANYGNAKSADNANQIDRLFAHEMTHLFHKEWMKSVHLELRTFKDSILWECIYEGMGTYRSLSKNWLPTGNALQRQLRQPWQHCFLHSSLIWKACAMQTVLMQIKRPVLEEAFHGE